MEKCGICLNSNKNTKQITEINTNNESYLKQLKTILPEIEWLSHYSICNECVKQLNKIIRFRNKCLELDQLRRENFSLLATRIKKEENLENFYMKSTLKITDINSLDNNKTISQLILDQNSEHKQSTDNKVVRERSNETEEESGNELESRLNDSSKTSNYECQKCGKLYKQEKGMKKHYLNCSRKNNNKTELKPKERRSRKIFSCELCNETRNFVKQLIEHCINDHSMDRKTIKPYTCNQCNNRFSTSASLVQHEKYHEGTRTHICSFCGKSYITKSDLIVHEYTHYNRRNYKCELCDKAFNTNKNLRSHKLVVHTDSNLWKYHCLKCNRRFPLKSGYDQHLRRHNGDKRFPCHICTKSFISRYELQKHVLFHSNIYAFKCEHCEKEYRDKQFYVRHLAKKHSLGNVKVPERVRKFACHICPKMYFDKQKLTRHLLFHSGVKPYGCYVCDKKFIDKYYLKRHLKALHNISETTDNILIDLLDNVEKSDEKTNL